MAPDITEARRALAQPVAHYLLPVVEAGARGLTQEPIALLH